MAGGLTVQSLAVPLLPPALCHGARRLRRSVTEIPLTVNWMLPSGALGFCVTVMALLELAPRLGGAGVALRGCRDRPLVLCLAPYPVSFTELWTENQHHRVPVHSIVWHIASESLARAL